jgi:hypothetical protein
MPVVIQAAIEILGLVAILGLAAITFVTVLYLLREFWRHW